MRLRLSLICTILLAATHLYADWPDAVAAFDRGDFAESEQEIVRLLETAPGSLPDTARALYLLGHARAAQANHTGALSAYERLLAEHSGSPWLLNALTHSADSAAALDDRKAALRFRALWLSTYLERTNASLDTPPAVESLVALREDLARLDPDADLEAWMADHYPQATATRHVILAHIPEVWEAEGREAAIVLLRDVLPAGGVDAITLLDRFGVPVTGRPETVDATAALGLLPDELPGPPFRRNLFLTRYEDLEQNLTRYPVPRRTMVVDGNDQDWEGVSPMPLDRERYLFGGSRDGLEDFSTSVRAAWDVDALYLLVAVRDDQHSQFEAPHLLWRGDSIQVGIDPNHNTPVTLNYDEDDIEMGFALQDNGTLTRHFSHALGAAGDLDTGEIRIQRAGDHTLYELAFPWKALLGIPEAFPGRELRLNVAVNDRDTRERECWMQWTPGITENKVPDWYPTLVLQ